MFSSEVVKMLYTGFWETIYMTLVSTALGYVIGLPLGCDPCSNRKRRNTGK